MAGGQVLVVAAQARRLEAAQRKRRGQQRQGGCLRVLLACSSRCMGISGRRRR